MIIAYRFDDPKLSNGVISNVPAGHGARVIARLIASKKRYWGNFPGRTYGITWKVADGVADGLIFTTKGGTP